MISMSHWQRRRNKECPAIIRMTGAAAAHFCSLSLSTMICAGGAGMREEYYLAGYYSGRHGEAVRQGHVRPPPPPPPLLPESALIFKRRSFSLPLYFQPLLRFNSRNRKSSLTLKYLAAFFPFYCRFKLATI
jgi:hypothetical protein